MIYDFDRGIFLDDQPDYVTPPTYTDNPRFPYTANFRFDNNWLHVDKDNTTNNYRIMYYGVNNSGEKVVLSQGLIDVPS
ncbi:hypothetical protein P4530_03165, partial [Bacillus thuringiensis]|nr:hypothetical protein [Bacillus thuringiensis]